MKIKMWVIGIIFLVVIFAALIISTLNLSSNDHKSPMPSAAEEMKKAKQK